MAGTNTDKTQTKVFGNIREYWRTLAGAPRTVVLCVFRLVVFSARSAPIWDELGGPQVYHIYFDVVAVGAKNIKCPRMGLIICLRG